MVNYTYKTAYAPVASNSAVPLLIQNSGVILPQRRSTEIMYDGLSRVPVRTGYRYRGHEYWDLEPFFLLSIGLKCTMGMAETSSMGFASVKHAWS